MCVKGKEERRGKGNNEGEWGRKKEEEEGEKNLRQ
jgi:hypothetical protein